MMALFAKADERFAKGEKETANLRKSIAEGFAESRKETAELRANMEKGFAESRKETAELRANMEKGFAESRKETAELRASIARLEVIAEKNNARLDEATADLKKNNAKLDKLDSEVGSLNNKLGGIIERAVLPDIVDKFKEKGFKFEEVSVRVEIMRENATKTKAKQLTEVDALLENDEFVIAVEAKTEMRVSDVDAHIKRLEILRKLSRFSGKKIYGALATAVARKGPVDYALKHGFYVLQRPDILGVKILDFPKGHSAKAW
jgi:hypothetical protein